MDAVDPTNETIASAELAERVRKLVEATGYPATSRTLGLSRGVVLSLMARVPVRPSSLFAADARAPRVT